LAMLPHVDHSHPLLHALMNISQAISSHVK
jgi:hypothetical protein